MTRKGFTLIELLVVVAVLALLASIVFSNLGGAREGARISNALSFQSQTHSLLGSDLVGWWNFNEGSGTTAGDISGYDNHGTIYGATHVDGVSGTGGSALDFDGTDDYVRIENHTSLNPTSAITVSAWVKWNEVKRQWEWLVAKNSNSGASDGYMLVNHSDTDKIGFIINGIYATVGRSTLVADNWYYFVGTATAGGYARFYIDGTLVHSVGTVPSPIRTYTGFLGINKAAYYASPVNFDGTIDDVRIYSRALTASEVQGLYAQTKGSYLAND